MAAMDGHQLGDSAWLGSQSFWLWGWVLAANLINRQPIPRLSVLACRAVCSERRRQEVDVVVQQLRRRAEAQEAELARQMTSTSGRLIM